ncbi:MAG: hypothetical protein O3B68_16870 [Planctomycetota bacterium]|nr:hypothetical protein [Planctomycetota bacterium]
MLSHRLVEIVINSDSHCHRSVCFESIDGPLSRRNRPAILITLQTKAAIAKTTPYSVSGIHDT